MRKKILALGTVTAIGLLILFVSKKQIIPSEDIALWEKLQNANIPDLKRVELFKKFQNEGKDLAKVSHEWLKSSQKSLRLAAIESFKGNASSSLVSAKEQYESLKQHLESSFSSEDDLLVSEILVAERLRTFLLNDWDSLKISVQSQLRMLLLMGNQKLNSEEMSFVRSHLAKTLEKIDFSINGDLLAAIISEMRTYPNLVDQEVRQSLKNIRTRVSPEIYEQSESFKTLREFLK